MKDACCTDNIKHAEDETTTKKNKNKFKLIFWLLLFFPFYKKEFD
jgi:hypothetical protein